MTLRFGTPLSARTERVTPFELPMANTVLYEYDELVTIANHSTWQVMQGIKVFNFKISFQRDSTCQPGLVSPLLMALFHMQPSQLFHFSCLLSTVLHLS